jgi:cytochrome b
LIAFSWWSVHNHHTDWHIWSGVAILTLLIFRLLWGFAGSSTARWTSFVRGPASIFAHLKGRWNGIGHTPLGALSVLAMLLAIVGQVGLGLISEDEDGIYAGPLSSLVSIDTSDQARDIHELWFNVILGLIGLHIAAILFYRLRGRKLTKPMITGRSELAPGTAPMRAG